MALIECRDCGKEISDTSEKCCYCGYNLKTSTANLEPEDRCCLYLRCNSKPTKDFIKELKNDSMFEPDKIKDIKKCTLTYLFIKFKDALAIREKYSKYDIYTRITSDKEKNIPNSTTIEPSNVDTNTTSSTPTIIEEKQTTPKICSNCYWMEKRGTILIPMYLCTNQSNCKITGLLKRELTYLEVKPTSSCDLFTPCDGGKSNNFKL